MVSGFRMHVSNFYPSYLPEDGLRTWTVQNSPFHTWMEQDDRPDAGVPCIIGRLLTHIFLVPLRFFACSKRTWRKAPGSEGATRPVQWAEIMVEESAEMP